MSEPLLFASRQDFHDWLAAYGSESGGVWLLFGKKGGPKTLSANDALEEALCFGWIDGQMQSLDGAKYKKYFARRRANSHWSDKNKKIALTLIENGLMKDPGYKAIEHAKKNGAWDAPKRLVVSDRQIQEFMELIQGHEPAYTNLLSMPLSVQRTYAGFYLDAKSEKTKETRIKKIIERLHKNLKPM